MSSRSGWEAALRWGEHVSEAPVFSSHDTSWCGALIRSWVDTAPEMELPALDKHLVVLHSGGPKRLTRRRDGRSLAADAPTGAVSVVPAGTGHSWSTRGPIAFTHLYFDPELIHRAVVEAYDRNPTKIHLADALGSAEPLLSHLVGSLREEAAGAEPLQLLLDSLFDAFLLTLLRRCSNLDQVSARAPCALAPRRLKRVLDCMEARLAEPITLDDLADSAGMSRFHFSRVFRAETGVPPYAYLLHRRAERAKTLLRETHASLPEVMERTGFSSPTRFAANFRRATGRSPAQYRREA
jgi:AraC family transcriptional regulator